MKILILDNYDSFTYNLVHAINQLLGPDDNLSIEKNNLFKLEQGQIFDKIILSPGPGIPQEAGILMPLIKYFAAKKPILGVCLGHQAIAEVFGATLINPKKVFHGISSKIRLLDKTSIFRNMPDQIDAGRYHSWLVNPENLPAEITITAIDKENQIMGLSHKNYAIYGVQFHPESFLTPKGIDILANFLEKDRLK